MGDEMIENKGSRILQIVLLGSSFVLISQTQSEKRRGYANMLKGPVLFEESNPFSPLRSPSINLLQTNFQPKFILFF